MKKLSEGYIQQEVIPKLKSYFLNTDENYSYANVAKELGGLAKSTISKLLKKQLASENTLHDLYKVFGIQEFEVWDKNHNIYTWAIEHISNHHWVSYRFKSGRQLYVSSWIFKSNGHVLEVWKKAAKGFNFVGNMTLDDDYNLSGKLSHEQSITLRYNTYLPVQHLDSPVGFGGNLKEVLNQNKFEWLIFDVVVKHGDEIYSTTEVLHLQEYGKKEIHPPEFVTVKHSVSILFEQKDLFMPTNSEYIAYNFLTHNNIKSRVPIQRNLDEIGSLLYYRHTIRIGCPVRSISQDDSEEFERLSAIAKSIKTTLIGEFHFEEKNIFFELTHYESLEHINQFYNAMFENNKTINHTYFIALIPKLKNNTTGIFTEIFYRIGKKLPVVIFYEDENSLGGVLSKLKNNGSIINTRFHKCPLEKVKGVLIDDPEFLLSYKLN